MQHSMTATPPIRAVRPTRLPQRQQQAAAQEAAEARRAAEASGRELGSASDYLASIMSELAVRAGGGGSDMG